MEIIKNGRIKNCSPVIGQTCQAWNRLRSKDYESLTYHTNNGCDISSLPLGVYLVDVLVDGKYLSTVKFIKIK